MEKYHGEGGEQSLAARASLFFFTISAFDSHFSRLSLTPLSLSTRKTRLDRAKGGMQAGLHSHGGAGETVLIYDHRAWEHMFP